MAKRISPSPNKPGQKSLAIQWIRPLAAPYLRGYEAKIERSGGLLGYSFSVKPKRGTGALGFFVGYLVETGDFDYLKPSPPECLIFASALPLGGSLHKAHVLDPQGTMHWTVEYIRWLTHRPPRFYLFENERAVLVRHFSMRDWPPEKYEHFAGNFFTETLAWLVRSGLVRRWRELAGKSKS